MIDMHNHILQGVDDGSKSLEESINLVKKARAHGMTGLVLTPHYMKGAMDTSVHILKERFETLQEALKAENIDIPLYLGHELYLDPRLIDDLKEEKCMSINKGAYVLMELPLKSDVHRLEAFVHELKIAGYKPILAHPERYAFVHKDINAISTLIDDGVAMQMNMSSLKGYYGKTVKKVARKMVKRGWVHCIGSDVHREKSSVLDIKHPLKYLRKMGGKAWIHQVTLDNPQAILNNEDLQAPRFKKRKRGRKVLAGLLIFLLLAYGGVKYGIHKVEAQFEAIMIEQGKAYKAEKLRQEALELEAQTLKAAKEKDQRDQERLADKQRRQDLRDLEDEKRLAAQKAEEDRLRAQEKSVADALAFAKNDQEKRAAQEAAQALEAARVEELLRIEAEEKAIEEARLEEERLVQEAIALEEARIEAERLEAERLAEAEKARLEAEMAKKYTNYETDKAKAMDLALSKLSVDQVNDLIKMSSGGFTADERSKAKVMFYNNFTAKEQEWILEMYAMYYGG